MARLVLMSAGRNTTRWAPGSCRNAVAGTLLPSMKLGYVRQLSAAGSAQTTKRAPAGYYGPRLAVGAASIVGSVALYELVSTQLRQWMQPPEDKEMWREDWDRPPVAEAPTGGVATPAEAALLAAERLRLGADARVGHRHVVFVRHAQPEAGDSEGGSKHLTRKGMHQAELTGQRLQALFGSVGAIYHSGSGEAEATVKVLRGYMGKDCVVRESALFAEGLPTIPSPRPAALGVVSDEELLCDSSRAEGAFRALMWRPTGECPEKASVEVVVGHGNVIRYLTCRAVQLPPTAWSRLAAYHCAVTWLDLDCEGDVMLREFGGVGHLPPELVTYH